MRNIQAVWLDPADQPQVQISDSDNYAANAQIRLDSPDAYGLTIVGGDPAALRALARAFDEAAVRLSATLDARAARQVNAGSQLDDISARIDATTTAWAAAGHPFEGPEHDAREAAFADLRAWNHRVGAA